MHLNFVPEVDYDSLPPDGDDDGDDGDDDGDDDDDWWGFPTG